LEKKNNRWKCRNPHRLFLEKIEEFSMDYDQKKGHEKEFEKMISNWCLQFIKDWRSNLHKNFA